ncbi:MAG TPA: outer membrane protein assembly factor BamE [Burkholderiales bacterium]|nr:outer membrane protein assembly factor BamE [Burkholderiales bacterium]
MPGSLSALALAALAASLWGCAAISPVKNGMDEMQVQARMGKPETVRRNSDGSETWEYPLGPAGRETYMVTVGSDHAVREVRQVLSERYFRQVTAGMSREQVRRLLGKPGDVSVFSARNEEVWSWRYQQENPMFFNVMFDRSAGTVTATQQLEEILFLDTDC